MELKNLYPDHDSIKWRHLSYSSYQGEFNQGDSTIIINFLPDSYRSKSIVVPWKIVTNEFKELVNGFENMDIKKEIELTHIYPLTGNDYYRLIFMNSKDEEIGVLLNIKK